MKKEQLDGWWAGLTIKQKERIASKAATKKAGRTCEVLYPNCTNWWIFLTDEEQTHIYEHCVDAHGYLLQEFQEGCPLSY